MDDGRRRRSNIELLVHFAIAAVALAVVTGDVVPAVVLTAWATALMMARLYVLGLILAGRLPTWAAVVLHIAVPVLGVAGLWLFASLAS